MKVQINYEYDATYKPPYFAWVKLDTGKIYGSGTNWTEARAQLIDTLKVLNRKPPATPDPEEVEI